MITDLKRATNIAINALRQLGRSSETILGYQQQFSTISKIATRSTNTTNSAIRFLETYSQARETYLEAMHASASQVRRHKRSVKLLMLALRETDATLVARQFSCSNTESVHSLPECAKTTWIEFRAFMVSKKYSSETIDSYLSKTKIFLRCLNECHPFSDFQTVTPDQVLDGLASYAKGRTKWISKAISAPKCYFKWLVAKGKVSPLIPSVFKLQLPKHVPKVKFFTPSEVEHLLNSLELMTPCDVMMHAIVTLVHCTGMRVGDVAKLKVSNIDWRKKEIAFIQSKTGRENRVPITNELATSLTKYLLSVRPHQAQEFVFVHPDYPFAPYNSQSIGQKFSDLRKKAFGPDKYQHYGLHAVRRGLGTRLFKSGTALPIIQEILGHTSETSLWAYIQADIAGLRECCLSVPGGG